MSRIIVSVAAISAAAIFAACGGATNTSVTVNRANTNTANANANLSTAIGNSIANAVTKATVDSPEDFIEAAAEGGMAEVELSKVALEKSQNPEVKKYAQMMVSEHTAANKDLKALAEKKSIAVPTGLGPHQEDVDDLKQTAGADFDRAYVDQMVADHESTIEIFQEQADSGTDADVKAFAAKTLPTLKKHLEQIKGIQAKLP